METLRLVVPTVPDGVLVGGTGYFDDGAGVPIADASLIPFAPFPLKTASGTLRCRPSAFQGPYPGYYVQGWQPDPTIAFTVTARFPYQNTTPFLKFGLIIGGDNLYNTGIEYIIEWLNATTRFTRTQHRTYYGNKAATAVVNLPVEPVNGNIIEMGCTATPGVSTMSLLFQHQILASDGVTVLTPWDVGATRDLATDILGWTPADPLRVGFLLSSQTDNMSITSWECAGTKRNYSEPSRPLRLAVIGDSNDEFTPNTTATVERSARVLPRAALAAVASDLGTLYDGVEGPIGFGCSGKSSLTWLNPLGATSQAYPPMFDFLKQNLYRIDGIMIKVGTNDRNVDNLSTNDFSNYYGQLVNQVRAINPTMPIIFVGCTYLAAPVADFANKNLSLDDYYNVGIAPRHAITNYSRVANLAPLVSMVGVVDGIHASQYAPQRNTMSSAIQPLISALFLPSGDIVNSFTLSIPGDYFDTVGASVYRDLTCVLTNTGNGSGAVSLASTLVLPSGSVAGVTTVGDWGLPAANSSKIVTLRLSADSVRRVESVVEFTASCRGFVQNFSVTIYNAIADDESPFQALPAGIGRTLELPVSDRRWICAADENDNGVRIQNTGDSVMLTCVAPYPPSTYVPPLYDLGEELRPGETRVYSDAQIGTGGFVFMIGGREVIPPDPWLPGISTTTATLTRGN